MTSSLKDATHWPGQPAAPNPSIPTLVGIVCFAYILMRPVSHNQVLLPTFALLGFSAAISIRHTRLRLADELRRTFTIQILFGLYGTVLGAAVQTQGWTSGALVYVVAPVLWWIWATDASEQKVRSVMRVIVLATAANGILISLFSATQRGLLPSVLPDSILTAQGAGFREFDGLTEIRFLGISTLAATGPICAAIAVSPRHYLLPSRRWALIASLAAAGASIEAGRRGQIVLIVIVFALIPGVRRVLRINTETRKNHPSRRGPPGSAITVYALLLLGALAAGVGISPPPAFSNALRSVGDLATGNTSGGVTIRLEQAERLLVGWSEQPVTGHGFGATFSNFARSQKRPWNFELQYHELLFQVGLIGVMLSCIGMYYALVSLRRAVAAAPHLALPLLVSTIGAVSMLIVNATNPYLKAPGHLWAIYLPFLVANVCFTSARRDQSHEHDSS